MVPYLQYHSVPTDDGTRLFKKNATSISLTSKKTSPPWRPRKMKNTCKPTKRITYIDIICHSELPSSPINQTIMHSLQKFSILFALFIVSSTDAFTSSKSAVKSTKLSAISAGNSDRRAFFRYAAGLASGGAILTSGGTQAYASYSAYTNREKDWQERKETGRKCLREFDSRTQQIHSAKQEIFCVFHSLYLNLFDHRNRIFKFTRFEGSTARNCADEQ